MKVLTDWQSGPPPCKGWWLARNFGLGAGFMTYIDPKDPVFCSDHFEWRGLAFNPENTYRISWAIGEPHIVIPEFIE